jgi:hypothetical protein
MEGDVDKHGSKRSPVSCGRHALVTAGVLVIGALAAAPKASAEAESKGCVTSWKALENQDGATVALRTESAWSGSPAMDYWGYAEEKVLSSVKCSQFWYQETFNTQGKHLLISGFWGSLTSKQLGPKQSQLGPDNCSHSHVTYYVWGSTNFGEKYVYIGGGAKTGQWDGSFCVITTTPDPQYPDFKTTWGSDVIDLAYSEYDAIVVAVQATSHWTGGVCGEFECYHPAHAVVAAPASIQP